MSTGASRPTAGAVVLTMNDRPQESPRAMASLLAQEGVTLDAVVGNGCTPEPVPGEPCSGSRGPGDRPCSDSVCSLFTKLSR